MMLATPPETVNATDTVNLFGTALGDLLTESRHPFAWCVVTDAFATTIAVVSDSPSRAVVDPFSFVAKRFGSRAAPFFTDSIPQILGHLDEALGGSAT